MTVKGVIKQVSDTLNTPQAFFTLVLSVAIGTMGAWSWASSNFVTVALGEEMMEKAQGEDDRLARQINNLAEEVQASNALLLVHMQKEELQKILDDIRRNEAEVYQIKQFVGVNGSNSQAAARLRALRTEHDDLIMRRDCVITQNDIC